MEILKDLYENLYFISIISILFTFLISVRMYPVIIYTVVTKNLMDEPNSRSGHVRKTPTLGGVGMFIVFSISISLLGIMIDIPKLDIVKILSILTSTSILLFLGIKDDLIAIAPKKKLIAQIISSGIIVFCTDVRILSFHGIFGLFELSYFISVLLSIFVFIIVINAYNLVDGIDGLAGSIAFLASLTFGFYFLFNGQIMLTIVSFALLGAILGFLRFNLSRSTRRKLFMGDSGSMFIGFLLAYQGISFMNLSFVTDKLEFAAPNAPVVLIAILSYPLLDTLRVFFNRMKKGKSPFAPDRTHIHHGIIDTGLTHKDATRLIIFFNIITVLISFFIFPIGINYQVLIVITSAISLYLFPTVFQPFLKEFRENKRKSKRFESNSHNGISFDNKNKNNKV